MSKTITQKPSPLLKICENLQITLKNKSQSAYEQLEKKSGSFFNLAKSYNAVQSQGISAHTSLWKGASVGAIAGGMAGGIIGLCASISVFGADLGGFVLFGACKGAAVGTVAGAANTFINNKKIIENNLTRELFNQRASFSPATQNKINQLKQASDQRGGQFKLILAGRFAQAWKQMRDLDFKAAKHVIANDMNATREIKNHFNLLDAASKVS